MHILLWFYLNLPMLPNCYFQPPCEVTSPSGCFCGRGQVSQNSSRQDLRFVTHFQFTTGWGPQSIAISCLKKVVEFYGLRYIELSGWWLSPTPLKMMEWVRQLGWWNSQYMESHELHVPNHQADRYLEDHPTDRLTWLTMVIVSSRFLGFSHV